MGNQRLTQRLKKAIILIPVICGIAVFVYMKSNRTPPDRIEEKEKVQAVRVITLQQTRVVPRVVSYGYVEPERTWRAIPEVSGRVVYLNENLRKGHFIRKDETLFKIDTATYGLAESREEADLMTIDARLKELEQTRENTRRLLEIEKQSLDSARLELKRKQKLFKNGYISASALEKEERSVLTHQNSVNSLQNTLDLIPAQKKALLAQQKSGETTVRQRQLDVARTEIRAPFNCRVASVNIEISQFAAAGSILAEVVGVDRAEIAVSLTPDRFFVLLPRDYDQTIGQTPDIKTLRSAMGIEAKVILPMDNHKPFEWEADFSRISEAVDVRTGALDVYVTVEKPYELAIPGRRPPLVGNMYVKVVLFGRPLDARFVIPRSAVHDGRIYISTDERRLEIRPVHIEFYMADMAVISQGVATGEMLVLSDLVPAVEGMRLNPRTDSDTQARLKIQARGTSTGDSEQ